MRAIHLVVEPTVHTSVVEKASVVPRDGTPKTKNNFPLERGKFCSVLGNRPTPLLIARVVHHGVCDFTHCMVKRRAETITLGTHDHSKGLVRKRPKKLP